MMLAARHIRVFATMLAAITLASMVHAAPRRSVTFVLGKDPDRQSFLSAAATYYAMLGSENDETVTTLRSLQDIREYLADPAKRGDAPWGTIRLVAHGSEWTGLRAAIFPGDSVSATLHHLEEAADSGAFPPLDRAIADAGTSLRIDSCGIGRRPPLLDAIARLFFGDNKAPQITASRNYVAFRAWTGEDGVRRSERTELPYVALVTREPSSQDRWRDQLEDRWRNAIGPVEHGALPLHSLPVEVRVDANASPAAVNAVLRDTGLRMDQLNWSDDAHGWRLGRAWIVTLADSLAEWSTDP